MRALRWWFRACAGLNASDLVEWADVIAASIMTTGVLYALIIVVGLAVAAGRDVCRLIF